MALDDSSSWAVTLLSVLPDRARGLGAAGADAPDDFVGVSADCARHRL